MQVTREEVVIDDRSVWLATPGKIEGLGKVLKSLKLAGGEGDSPVVVAARQSRQVEQWEQTYGMSAEEWLERFGEPREQPSARTPPRRVTPPAYQQRGRSDPAMFDQRGPELGQFEAPSRTGGRRQGREQALGSPARRSRQPQRAAPDQPQQQAGTDAAPGRRQGGRVEEAAEAWGDRPAYGSVLQPDPRSLEYEEAQRPPLERCRDDEMRSDEAF